jgi:hypothetical protein
LGEKQQEIEERHQEGHGDDVLDFAMTPHAMKEDESL